MSYTYGSFEAKTFVKAGTTIKATAGLNLKLFIVKCPATATSVAVTGISAAMLLQTAYGVKMSGAVVKTSALMTTACSLGAAKVIFAAVKALTGAAIHVLVHDAR
jgi:hypothetical protein